MTSLTPVDAKVPIKQFPEVDALCYSWCPTMDLIALTVGNGKRVLVFRMNGKKVWDIPVKLGIAKNVVWRPDGRQLAIVTTKLQTLIYDSNTARLLSTLQSKSTADVNFGHWIVSDAPEAENKFSGILDEQEITKALPRLPPLPSSNNSENTFTTRQAIDGMIQTENHGIMDLLFLFGDKSVTITLHGLFLLGAVDIVLEDHDADIANAATRTVEDHYFLTTSFTTMQHTLRRFTTQFVQSYGFLQGITLSSSKIIALLGYIEEVLSYSTQAIKAYTEFNSKFVGILKDELEERNEIVTDELYNLLLTGMMNDQLKDWVQNTVGDRGVKRWSKIGETAFDTTRRTIIYHLVPACERTIMLLSNLGALAKTSSTLNEKLELSFLTNSIEAVKKMMKLLFDFIFKINREQELFNSFIIWIQSILSELQDEQPKETYVTSEVSTFINDHLQRSALMMLVPFLRRNFNEIKIHTHDMFESIKSQVRSSITVDESFEMTLGRVTEKQHMRFIEDDLYIVTHYDSNVNIFKVDVLQRTSESINIEFAGEISDVQITEQGDLYVVTNGAVLRTKYDTLFNGEQTSTITQGKLSFSRDEDFSGLQTKHLAVNGSRNIGCAISDDLKRYTVFFLDDEPV